MPHRKGRLLRPHLPVEPQPVARSEVNSRRALASSAG
jgi:hypothetical protein